MNILFLHSSSDLYGASKILLAINEQCFIKGHKAIVVLSDNGPLVEKLEASGVRVIISDLGILRRQYLHPRGVYNRLKSNYNAYQFLIQLCKAEQIDLIYSNTTGVVVGVFVAAKLNIKHLWHIHEIIEKRETILINSNFSCNYYINREQLFHILKTKYNVNF